MNQILAQAEADLQFIGHQDRTRRAVADDLCLPHDADRVEIGKVFPKVRIVETKTYSTAIERDSEPQPKPESKEIGTFEESPHLDVQFALRRLLFRYIEDTFKGKILPCAQIVVEGWLKSKYSPYPNSTKVCDDCFNSMVNFVTELVDDINANEPEGFADLVRDQVIRVNYADSVN